MGLDPAMIRRYAASSREGVCWSFRSHDLDVNLVAWSPSHGVESHVNEACDVLLVGLRGRGWVEVDGRRTSLGPGAVVMVPRGAHRAIRARTRLVYLSGHRRRTATFDTVELFAPRPHA